jgi:hypothetical protein
LVNQDAQRKGEVKIDTMPQNKELAKAYQLELETLVNQMTTPEGGIGVAPTIGMLRQKLMELGILLNNVVTVEAMLPTWIDNFSRNYVKHIANRAEVPGIPQNAIKDSAIVVGAGDSVMCSDGKNIEALKAYKGTIICTNKSFGELVRHGVVPHYVVAIHSTEEILVHFENKKVMDALLVGGTTVILSTMVDPRVADKIMSSVAEPEQVVWFNPSIPDTYAPNIDTVINIMSGLPLLDTGGNAGLFAVRTAILMGAKRIGILGMEHCLELSNGWTNEQARGYDIIFAPEDGKIFAITPVFKGYLESMMQTIDEYRKDVKVFNLTPNGLLYTDSERLKVPYSPVDYFVVKYD